MRQTQKEDFSKNYISLSYGKLQYSGYDDSYNKGRTSTIGLVLKTFLYSFKLS